MHRTLRVWLAHLLLCMHRIFTLAATMSILRLRLIRMLMLMLSVMDMEKMARLCGIQDNVAWSWVEQPHPVVRGRIKRPLPRIPAHPLSLPLPLLPSAKVGRILPPLPPLPTRSLTQLQLQLPQLQLQLLLQLPLQPLTPMLPSLRLDDQQSLETVLPPPVESSKGSMVPPPPLPPHPC